MIDKIIQLVRENFAAVADPRRNNFSYTMANLLGLAFAMFHLKDGSLSAFREQFSIRTENLERVYGVELLPGDIALREGIDEVLPEELQGLFNPMIDFLQE